MIDLHAGDDEVRNLQSEVGGVFDVVAHRECDLWINDEGRINGSPVNVRVSHWVLNASEKAKEGRVGEWRIDDLSNTFTIQPRHPPSRRIRRA